MITMGRRLNTKNSLIATRITSGINIAVKKMAFREGLTVSEWIRNLIVAELKKNDALPKIKLEYKHNV
jgi:hypothetical protein